ncbi:MAG: dTDP-4-dehydrorhamnose 3,5-epimerase family protein [Candidatus Omnitrophica bacterium]|nr:dTDP-4-dehydrorhamnose 3,5-epimerase family protein [Candidatus Omnitrophota bacterium]
MKLHNQRIEGVRIIEAEPFKDDRGMFFRHFCKNEYEENGLNGEIVQTNISKNIKKYTLRGMHYQAEPLEECKTMFCLSGSIYDVIVDLRPDSDTFMQWISIELDSKEPKSIYLPAGCANGYLTLEDNTSILYYMSEFYSPKAYRGFRYNDPAFKIRWPQEPLVISDKDNVYPDFVFKKA